MGKTKLPKDITKLTAKDLKKLKYSKEGREFAKRRDVVKHKQLIQSYRGVPQNSFLETIQGDHKKRSFAKLMILYHAVAHLTTKVLRSKKKGKSVINPMQYLTMHVDIPEKAKALKYINLLRDNSGLFQRIYLSLKNSKELSALKVKKLKKNQMEKWEKPYGGPSREFLHVVLLEMLYLDDDREVRFSRKILSEFAQEYNPANAKDYPVPEYAQCLLSYLALLYSHREIIKSVVGPQLLSQTPHVKREHRREAATNNNERVVPKYIRVNRHAGGTEKELEATLERSGLKKISFQEAFETLEALKNTPYYAADDERPGLYMIPGDYATHTIPMVYHHRAMIQDRSSCVPPHILMDTLKKLNALPVDKNQAFIIVDACAAPGNKTSLLAELLLPYPNAKVVAIERDHHRAAELEKRMVLLSVKNVEVIHGDSMQYVGPEGIPILAVMVDPTCSGSGTFVIEKDMSRTVKLSQFQYTMLTAMAKKQYPLLVYSTCSDSDIEGEQVVSKIVERFPEYSLLQVLPEFQSSLIFKDNAGIEAYDKCARFNFRTHRTGGFFVSALVNQEQIDYLSSWTKEKSNTKSSKKEVVEEIPIIEKKKFEKTPKKEKRKKRAKAEARKEAKQLEAGTLPKKEAKKLAKKLAKNSKKRKRDDDDGGSSKKKVRKE